MGLKTNIFKKGQFCSSFVTFFLKTQFFRHTNFRCVENSKFSVRQRVFHQTLTNDSHYDIRNQHVCLYKYNLILTPEKKESFFHDTRGGPQRPKSSISVFRE
jgi:hypothetical protein